jgi:NAD-dependent SIR2 family protein deacetylase
MTYQAFTGSAAARRRYWARSHVGWPVIASAAPNSGHRAVAELGRRGLLAGVITQNVDGLHQAAGAGGASGSSGASGASGASGVTELHGSLHRVICLACGQRTPRAELDRRLGAANPGWREAASRSPARLSGAAGQVNPDGDAVLDEERTESFQVVGCRACQGVLKPDVVFFGENVPKARVQACYALVERANALVVLGSSLTVMSGFRYVRHASRLGLPVVIVNQGATRGDEYAKATLDAPLGPTLTALVKSL